MLQIQPVCNKYTKTLSIRETLCAIVTIHDKYTGIEFGTDSTNVRYEHEALRLIQVETMHSKYTIQTWVKIVLRIYFKPLIRKFWIYDASWGFIQKFH